MQDQGLGMNILMTEERDRIGTTGWSRVEAELLAPTGLPTGIWKELALVSRRPAAATLPVDYENGRIAFARQGRVGAGGAKVTEALAGVVDPGEDPQETAARETEVETGLRPTSIEVVASNLLVTPGYSGERKSLYIASGLKQGRKRMQDAHIELIWEPLDELDRLIDQTADGGDQTTLTLLLAFWRHLKRKLPDTIGNAR